MRALRVPGQPAMVLRPVRPLVLLTLLANGCTCGGAPPPADAAGGTDAPLPIPDAPEVPVDSNVVDGAIVIVDSALEPDAAPGFSSVVRLDGDGDGVELPRNADYGAVGNRFTMELWFKPASADTNDYGVLYTRRAHYGEYGLNYSEDDNGLVHFEVYVDGADSLAGGMWLYSRTRPTVGVWHHAAGVVDGRAVRLYLDGVLEAEATAPGDITWQPDEPRATLHDEYRTFVGYTRSPGDGGMRYIGRFTGDVDDVHISRVARYTGASFVPPRLAIADANTVGLWTFEEPSGATAEDHSPGGTLDGTILGAVRVPGGR